MKQLEHCVETSALLKQEKKKSRQKFNYHYDVFIKLAFRGERKMEKAVESPTDLFLRIYFAVSQQIFILCEADSEK